MQTLREWTLRLWGTIRRRRSDADLDEELRAHLELAAEDARSRGLTPAAAVRDKRLAAGSTASAIESMRDQRGLPWLEDLARDLKHSLRLLRRSPGFTAAAALSLALGIGATTAIFSLIDAVMLRQMPVREPGRLVQIVRHRPPYGRVSLSYPQYVAFRDNVPSFESVLAYSRLTGRTIQVNGRHETVDLELVSDNYFAVLGVDAAIGRVFSRSAAQSPEAVISDRLWRRHFSADPLAIGRTIQVNATIFTIVGITPPRFTGPTVGQIADVTVPIALDGAVRGTGSWQSNPAYAWLSVMGRLRANRSIAHAQSEASTVIAQTNDAEAAAEREPERKGIRGQTVTLQPAGNGFDDLRRRFSEPLIVLMGAVSLLLLITCVNLANLLLARASTRESEMALRCALGASRPRLVRQLVTEGLLLAIIGGAIGVALAYGLANALIGMMSNGGTRLAVDVEPDVRMLGFAAAVAILCCLLFSLAPALKSTARASDASAQTRITARSRFGAGLIAVQVAISIVLVIGAGLFARTLRHFHTLDAGFGRTGVYVFAVNAARSGYSGDRLAAVERRIAEDIAALPGIASVSHAMIQVLSGGGWDGNVSVVGQSYASGRDPRVHLNAVGPSYFATIGTPLITGREFTESDNASSSPVAIVNESFAKSYFGTGSPIGSSLVLDGPQPQRAEIVGVVRDMKYMSLRQPMPRTVFLPQRQMAASSPAPEYVVRTHRGVANPVSAIEAVLERIDPSLRADNARSMTEHISRTLLEERLLATLTTCLGALGLALVAVGVYGVVAFQANRRTKEMGIRLALGARPRQVVQLVVREMLVPVVAGVVAGLTAAFQITGFAEKMLYGVTPTDPATLVGSCLMLIGLTITAAWLPGRRAARLNPATTLREG
jgi:predicted permease